MTFVPKIDESFALRVRLGEVEGWASGQVIGRSAMISGTEAPVWEQGGLYTFESSAGTWYISSSSASDTSRTILIQGLAADYSELVLPVVTDASDGRTPVAVAAPLLRVNGMINISAEGSDNIGDIYLSTDNTDITAGVPNTQSKIKDKIIAGANIARSTIFTVPLGVQMLIQSAKANAGKDNYAAFGSVVKPLGQVPFTIALFDIYQGFSDIPFYTIGGSAILDEKTDTWQLASTTNPAGATVTSGYEYFLVDK